MTLLDELVQPTRPVTDYNTRYSGITAALLATATLTAAEVRGRVLALARGGGGGAGGGGGGSGGDGGAGVPGGYIYSETAGLTVEMRHRRRREQGEEKDGDCRHVKYLPARVKQIGKIESRGKVLKLSDKVVLTRPFTARGNCLP